MRRTAAAGLALALAACAPTEPNSAPGGPGSGIGSDDDPEALRDEPSVESPADYNRNGVEHRYQWIRLKRPDVPLYDAGFRPLGPTIRNQPHAGCPGGSCVEFQGIEKVVARLPDGSTRQLYYSLGFADNLSGFVDVSDLEGAPVIDPGARAGNGGSAPDVRLADGTRKSCRIDPRPIEPDLVYPGVSDPKKTYHYWHYGTPGEPAYTDYTYLVWSWINRSGGGITRAPLRRGEVFYPSRVASIKTWSHRNDGQAAPSGWVKVIYGFADQGGNRIYGWTVHSHQYGNHPIVYHVRP